MITSKAKLILLVACSLSLVSASTVAQIDGLPLQEGVSLDAPVIASGLNFPVGLVVLPDGSLLVGSSNPTGGSYFSSTGELLRFIDLNENGTFEEPPNVVATDLAGMVTAVAVEGDLVFVTSAESRRERIQILRAPDDWAGPYQLLGEIRFDFRGFGHQSYGLATRPSASDPHAVELFFNIGASGNDSSGRAVPASGLLDAHLPDAALYMTTVTDEGAEISLSEPVQIATGLRNAMAFGFHPKSGDLWITDNGIDGLEDVWTSYSADELNMIPADRIGGEAEDFGFPTTYTLYATGEIIGGEGILPIVAFVPVGSAENEGVASMAFTPPTFTSVFGEGVIVGFHGQYDMWGSDNEENALLFVDLATSGVSTLVPPGSPEVGHLNSVAAAGDAVYIADMCVGASLAQSAPCGVLYRLEPA
ncbi:MAG: hypothetical protein AB7V46_19405 [Thermomicrobiales bacterium]